MKKRTLSYFISTACVGLGLLAFASCGGPLTGDVVTLQVPKGPVEFGVEVVRSEEDVARGLSGVASLPANRGMLFDFEYPEIRHFWMKDMKIPLDIIFVGGDAKVVHVVKNVQPCTGSDEECTSYSSMKPALYVLEINAGLADKYGITPGTSMELSNR